MEHTEGPETTVASLERLVRLRCRTGSAGSKSSEPVELLFAEVR